MIGITDGKRLGFAAPHTSYLGAVVVDGAPPPPTDH